MTKTLKKLFAAILLGVVMSVPLMSISPHKAAAASYPIYTGDSRTSYLAVYLQGATGNLNSYTVKAVRQAPVGNEPTNISFTYKSNGYGGDTTPLFLGDMQAAGASTCTVTSPVSVQKGLTFVVSVTQNGKSVSSDSSYNFCGHSQTYGYVSGPLQISVTGASAPKTSVSGTFNFTDNTGTVHPFVGANTIATLTQTTGSKIVYPLAVNSIGQFSIDNLTPGSYILTATYSPCTGGGCAGGVYGPEIITLKAGGNALGSLNTSTPPNTAAGGSGTDCGIAPSSTVACNTTPDCGAGALNWIVCSVIMGAESAAVKVDGFITNTLNTDVKGIFDNTAGGGSSQAYYTAWNSFRLLATAILLIGGLVMVVSQALGFEILDAYTIRKTLPRLLVAVIGISLSWPLMRFVISFFDILGFDVRNLIYAPFSHLGGHINVQVGLLSFFAVGAAVVLMGFASLTLILTALMAVFVGFIILVVRQLAIIVLIILAPLAIACYVLPNTQKVWKLWFDNFLGLMVVFPIISAFIATGRVFAAVSIAPGTGNSGGDLAQIVGLVAYFAPYFLLPVAFRLATGAIGAVGGFVNDRHKGAFEGLKNIRGAARSKNWQKIKAGERFGNADPKSISGRANTVLQKSTRPASFIPGRLGATSRSILSTNTSSQTGRFVKLLQEAGLLDDAAGNEFIQHGGSLGSLMKRVGQLRGQGKGQLADTLAAYAQFAGQRGAILGAAKLNASFGKLSDASLDSMNGLFGSSVADRAAKSAAFGDLIFTSKNAGNYVTYAAKMDGDGKIISFAAQKIEDSAKAYERLADKLKDGGPSVVGALKPFEDGANGGRNAKEEALIALAKSARVSRDRGDEHNGALEQLAMASMPGAYTDPRTKEWGRAAVAAEGLTVALDNHVKLINSRGGAVPDANNPLLNPPPPPPPQT